MSTDTPTEMRGAASRRSLADLRIGGYTTVCGRVEALAPETDDGVLIGTVTDHSGKLNFIVPPTVETPTLQKGGWFEMTDLQADIGPQKLVLVATAETTVTERRPEDYFEYPPLGETDWIPGGIYSQESAKYASFGGEVHSVLSILRVGEGNPYSLTIAHGNADRFLEVHDVTNGAAETLDGGSASPDAEFLGGEALPYPMTIGEACAWFATHGEQIDGFRAETRAELATIAADLSSWAANRPTMADYHAKGTRCPDAITANGKTRRLYVSHFLDSLAGPGQYIELSPTFEARLRALCETLGAQSNLKAFT